MLQLPPMAQAGLEVIGLSVPESDVAGVAGVPSTVKFTIKSPFALLGHSLVTRA